MAATVAYDHRTDTLYINYDVRRLAYRAVEEPAGVVRRYDETGDLCGVTILDFTHRLQGGNYILGEKSSAAE